MSTLTEDKLGPIENPLNQHEAEDAYDWDAVSALEQAERVRTLAIEAAVREHSRQALAAEAGPTLRSAVGADEAADEHAAAEKQL